MDQEDEEPILTNKTLPCLEIRLFYVRISPCLVHALPDHLTLCHPRRHAAVSLVVNAAPVPSSSPATLPLRRDRVDRHAAEVTYVATDTVSLSATADFEIYHTHALFLRGSLQRLHTHWGNSASASDSGWAMDCHVASSSSFFAPRLGVSAPSIEVYVAGCCSGVPVVLSKTIQMTPRRRVLRHATLDAIPEEDEMLSMEKNRAAVSGFIPPSNLQITGPELDDYDSDGKMGNGFYSHMYPGEDGQLSWFNAGVRVGVGIGLGMCVGIGIGVGLLMRSYQTTTRNFRRRFF